MKVRILAIFLLLATITSTAQISKKFFPVAGKYLYNLPYEKIFGDWINEWKNDPKVTLDSASYDDSTGDHYYFGKITDFQPFDIKTDRTDFFIRKNNWTIANSGSQEPYIEGTFSLQLVFNFSKDSSIKIIRALAKKIDKEFTKCTDRSYAAPASDTEKMKDFGAIFYFNFQEKVPILKMSCGETKRRVHPIIIIQLDFSVK